jgi:hypothetical protein
MKVTLYQFLRVCMAALTADDIVSIDAAGAEGARQLTAKKMLKRLAASFLVGAVIYILVFHLDELPKVLGT